jgi:tetratricopeptide (TPR) repeat protein
MGGVGKTELATQYARTHEADYPGGICWLNARDTDLAAEIIQFAQLYLNLDVPQELGGRWLNLEEQVAWCWQNWYTPPAPLGKGGVREGEGRVLVVLDDVTDLRSCRKVLPRANRFRVLMTTRLRRIDTNFVEIPLNVLSPPEAWKLLAALLGDKDRRVQQERETAECLCAWLGYLPLGLELVGRYLAEDPDLSLAQMLERLKAHGVQDEAIDLDEQQLQNTFSTAQRGVRAAFKLSWQELDPMTQRVAQYLSLFAPTIFLWEWVESETELLNCAESEINAAKKQLYKRHLIQQAEEREGGYKIHSLIREFLQGKLAESEHKDKFTKAFAATFVAFAKTIPQSSTRDLIDSRKDFIPHLEEVAQNLAEALSDDDLVWPFVGLGRFYEGQALYALAELWFKQCLALSQCQLGEDHLDVALSLNNLAGLYYCQGRYSESEPLYVQALALRKRQLREDDLGVALILNNLAGIYDLQGHYSKAELLHVQALELRERLLGEDNLDVAQSLNNLAALYNEQERYSDAEPLLVKALTLYKRLLVEDHPHVATSLNNLAYIYRSQGRYDKAEPLLRDALALRKRLLGEDHPDVAQSLNNLALLYSSQERYSEAEPLYVEALALRKRLLGEDHPDVVTSLNNLAGLYYFQGRYLEAEPLFVQALTLSERVSGVSHPRTINIRENLALFEQERSTSNS